MMRDGDTRGNGTIKISHSIKLLSTNSNNISNNNLPITIYQTNINTNKLIRKYMNQSSINW
jgi:hypothetical protein